jgi:hypothetical protein
MVMLKLGTIDVSDYLEEGYSVRTEPVYDSASFKNIYEQEKADLIGRKVSISANLGDVPKSVAEAICSACETDTLSVTYATPKAYTATFKRPDISCELTIEEPETWDISLSMSTDTIPLDGL